MDLDDLGLPVFDLVLPLESGEPDLDLVLPLLASDLLRPLGEAAGLEEPISDNASAGD